MNFHNWFDGSVWYPYGRDVGATVYPGTFSFLFILLAYSFVILFGHSGLMWTAAIIYKMINFIGFPITVKEACVYTPVIFSVFTVLLTYCITKRMWTKHAALISALLVAVAPGYMARSTAGAFDNESISVTLILLVCYLWTASIQDGSVFMAILCALAYFCLAAAWGGHVYVANLLPLSVLALLLLRRYTPTLRVCYNIFCVLGMLLSMQVRVVSAVPLHSPEYLLAFLALVCVNAEGLIRTLSVTPVFSTSPARRTHIRIAVSLSALVLFVLGVSVALCAHDAPPLSGRLRVLLLLPLRVLHIHTQSHSENAPSAGAVLVESVAEHAPLAWAPLFAWASVLLLLLIPALFLAFSRVQMEESDTRHSTRTAFLQSLLFGTLVPLDDYTYVCCYDASTAALEALKKKKEKELSTDSTSSLNTNKNKNKGSHNTNSNKNKSNKNNTNKSNAKKSDTNNTGNNNNNNNSSSSSNEADNSNLAYSLALTELRAQYVTEYNNLLSSSSSHLSPTAALFLRRKNSTFLFFILAVLTSLVFAAAMGRLLVILTPFLCIFGGVYPAYLLGEIQRSYTRWVNGENDADEDDSDEDDDSDDEYTEREKNENNGHNTHAILSPVSSLFTAVERRVRRAEKCCRVFRRKYNAIDRTHNNHANTRLHALICVVFLLLLLFGFIYESIHTAKESLSENDVVFYRTRFTLAHTQLSSTNSAQTEIEDKHDAAERELIERYLQSIHHCWKNIEQNDLFENTNKAKNRRIVIDLDELLAQRERKTANNSHKRADQSNNGGMSIRYLNHNNSNANIVHFNHSYVHSETNRLTRIPLPLFSHLPRPISLTLQTLSPLLSTPNTPNNNNIYSNNINNNNNIHNEDVDSDLRVVSQSVLVSDLAQAYSFLQSNTEESARVMAWWDYGYQLSALARRRTLVDNHTHNTTHIALVAKVSPLPSLLCSLNFFLSFLFYCYFSIYLYSLLCIFFTFIFYSPYLSHSLSVPPYFHTSFAYTLIGICIG